MKHVTPVHYFFLLLVVTISALSCWGFYSHPYYTDYKRWAWKPVYGIDTSYKNISYTLDTPVVNAGNIYVKGNYIYQCEIGAGIHITDNTNPATAKRIGFLKVPGCEEISIKGNVLYTNNYYDLVAINISDFTTPAVISRTPKAFYGNNSSPHSWEQPNETGYYQCPNYYDDSVIVKWVRDSVYATCFK